MRFYTFMLLLLSQPAILIPLMIVDELFSSLTDYINLNTTYYWVPLIGRLDIWTSWEASFVIILCTYEATFTWLMWNVLRPNQSEPKVSSLSRKDALSL